MCLLEGGLGLPTKYLQHLAQSLAHAALSWAFPSAPHLLSTSPHPPPPCSGPASPGFLAFRFGLIPTSGEHWQEMEGRTRQRSEPLRTRQQRRSSAEVFKGRHAMCPQAAVLTKSIASYHAPAFINPPIKLCSLSPFHKFPFVCFMISLK